MSASVSSLDPGDRVTRGRTVLTTRPVYARLPCFVRRNVAVNKLTAPIPMMMFPMTASIPDPRLLLETTRIAPPMFPPDQRAGK